MPNAGEKLLEAMRQTKHGWGADDLHALYVAFGFWYREGPKHRVYIHKEFPELRATVARHGSLPVGYAQTAVKLIDRLRELKRPNPRREGRDASTD